MTRLKEAFTRLRIPPFPVQVVDPMQVCLQLTAALDRLEVLNGTVASLPRSPLDATDVWDKWVLLLFDLTKLSRLEFRTLCQSPATAMNPVFVSALARNPTGLERLPSLCAFVQSYFSKWRNMVQPDQVENIIQGLLEHMAGKSTVIAKWRDLPGLVSATADHALAHAIVRAQSSMNVLKRYNVGATTGLATAAQQKAIELAVADFGRNELQRDMNSNLAIMKWIRDDLLRAPLTSGTFYKAFGSLILSASAERFPKFQQELSDFALNDSRLGDPRRNESSPKWAQVPEGACARFRAWLARDAIRFFFTEGCNDERRKTFWLGYHGRVRNFRCALSTSDELRLKKSMKDFATVPSYSKIKDDPEAASAILMEFRGYGGRDYVVVEGGKTGYAAQIYELSDFLLSGATLERQSLSWSQHLRLKNLSKHRIIHNGDWEPKAQQALTLLGIVP